MQEKIIKKNHRKRLAISEIILLITGIIAFSCLLGNSFPVVNAYEGGAEMCIKSSAGIEFRVNAIIDINAWCLANGGSQVCTGGSNNWKLRVELIYPCVAKTAPTTTEQLVITPIITGISGETARKILKSAPASMESAVFVPAEEGAEKIVEKKAPGWFKKMFFTGKKTFSDRLPYAAVTAAVVVLYSFLSTWRKTGDLGRAKDAALRVAIGAAVGYGALEGLIALGVFSAGPAGWVISGFIMLGVWASKFLKREQDREITFTCKPWQAQAGGADCELCNDKDFPCTEYQCESLGTGCEIINKDTDEPRCIHKDDRDVNPPVIQPWEDTLTEGYDYIPLPPVEGTGVEIKYGNEECLPAFQPFIFGVELDKDGYCRIDFERTASFEDMESDFGGRNIFITQHNQPMSFPGVVHLEREIQERALNITIDSEIELYVRCQAATNGKASDEFIFKFCIDKGPDTTSPEIRGFNKIDGTPIAYFEEGEPREVDVQVYVNEPAQCKWSHEDKSYENMENDLTCPDSLIKFNAQLSYTCTGKLIGLENSRENKFFFRCNDTFGNINIQSKTLTLIGTQPLFISSVKPNETTIKSSSDLIKVTFEAETSAGYKQGEATCEYSTTGTSGSYVVFSNTNSHRHSENVWLGPGEHNYFIRCVDLAGNSDRREISFKVETDTYAPIVVRVFHDGSNLKIITHEEAICVYDNKDCLYDFDDGIKMTSTERTHTTEWNPNKNFYIKCQDQFGNQPPPQSCSITVRPFEI